MRCKTASLTDRLDKFLRMLKVLRFAECADKVHGSKVHRFGLVALTVINTCGAI